ncbi:YezD family protein [Paludisphaera rhizosphaerae]|uniref:YezD family protein n=1 Tax=Paludisphaera rhizosphaerae TaxID=2711216 RepID=UPI0013ED4B69|nr:YezD family protein [Paludisphaera rhizosphaerae]
MAERTSISRNGGKTSAPAPAADVELERIREAVRGIQFGEVRIVIQDGLIVQVERLEKQRFR